jgi:MFS family permease
MKKSLPTLCGLCLCAALLVAQPVTASAETATKSHAPGAQFAESISTITGVAISPLLGTSAYGAVKYFKTPKDRRANLPWFAQPWFWVPALLLVAACVVKDTAGTALPTAAKKPLDVAETVENKISGLIAAGAFVPFIAMMSHELSQDSTMLSAMGFAAADFSWLYNIFMVPLSIAVFAIVFLAANAINILILLSPFTIVDAALKTFRTAILATVAGTSLMNPWIGAAWALVIIGISYFIAGWSFRLTHFGAVFTWDFFTRRQKRFKPDPVTNKVFLGRKLNKVPARTYGRLCRDGHGKLVLRYRPWLVLPQRTLEIPDGKYEAGRGVFYSEVLRVEDNEAKTAMLLPPRYLGHEGEFVKIYGFAGTREVGVRAAWTWLKELFGFKAQPQVAAA